VSIDGKCVNTCEPSMPSHRKEWCGKTFCWFHEIFCVKNHSKPARRMS
jgi:hypothetical protein